MVPGSCYLYLLVGSSKCDKILKINDFPLNSYYLYLIDFIQLIGHSRFPQFPLH